MSGKFDPEFDAIRAALVSKPELTKDLNVSIRNLLRLTEHLQNSGLRMERHGRWLTWEEMFPGQTPKKKNNLGVFCDQCKNHADNRTDFCPSCGAKMDEEKEND